MLRVSVVESSRAPLGVAEVYTDFRTKMGFPAPPNFIKVQGASLAAVQGTWGLVRNILLEGLLPRSLMEMAFVAISKDRGCRYCEAAHLACCRMLGVDARTLEILVSNVDEVSPQSARAVLRFALKCARASQDLNEEDFSSLRHHGFVEGEITELIAMAGLAV